MERGGPAGGEMAGVGVFLVGGRFHEVDSSEMAFKIAGSMAFKEACNKAQPVLLEPIMRVEAVVPEEYMAPVFGNLNARRAQIQGNESRADAQIIRAQVPLATLIGYATAL